MFVETVQGAAALAKLYEQRSILRKLFKDITALILHKRKTLVVFGPGGTGKTTLGTLLSGELDTDKGAKVYNETTEIETFSLQGEHSGKAIIAPGQEWRRPSSWDDLYRLISSGKSTTVVNVVAFGFHATELERDRLVPNFFDAADDTALRQAWFSQNREKEIRALQEILPHLQAAPGELRLITLVNKQDLWWADRGAARAFYENGEYADTVNALASHRGHANFRHELVSAAMVEHNLKSADGFDIALTSAGYDDALRAANLERAAAVINRMLAV